MRDLRHELAQEFPVEFDLKEDRHWGFVDNTTGRGHEPLGIFRVKDRETLPRLLAWCRDHSVSVYPLSTGSNWGYGSRSAFTHHALILDLSALHRILDFDDQLGTITIEPGVTQQQVYDFLQTRGGRCLVPTTGAGPQCSLLSNALERGFGLTPHTDHFWALQNCEILLANGEILRDPFTELGTPNIGKVFRWGLGPYLTGLFTQSSLGIVLSGTFALARRPEVPLCLILPLNDDSQLQRATDLVREELSELGSLWGGINFLNNLRMLTMKGPCPQPFRDTGSAIPSEEILKSSREEGISAWTGLGNLLVPKDLQGSLRRRLRQRFRRAGISCFIFSEEELQRWVWILKFFPFYPLKPWRRSLQQLLGGFPILFGKPSTVALSLVSWRSQVPGNFDPQHPDQSDAGLIWYAPIIELKSEMILKATELFTQICRNHQMDCPITLTCFSPRFVEATIPLLFNRHRPEEVQRAQACFQELLERGKDLGVFPYRVGTMGMKEILSSGSTHWKTVSLLKKSLDPENLISPGHYTP